MSRNKKLLAELRTKTVSSQDQVEDEDQDHLAPMDALAGDAAKYDEIDDLDDEGESEGRDERSAEEDPIQALQKQLDEIRAAKQSAEDRLKERDTQEERYRADLERERSERVAIEAQWREEQKRRAEAEKTSLTQHKAVIEHAIAASKADLETAKRAYAEAMTNMDYVAAAEAQEKIAEAKVQVSKLSDGHQQIQERIDAPEPELERRPEPRREIQAQQDLWDAAISGYSLRDQQWLRAHKADIANNPQRQQLAQAADIAATAKHGIERGSDEYYAFLDDFMGYVKQTEPAQHETRQPLAKRGPVVPSAPVSRSNVSGNDVLPRLDRDQRLTARALNMTDSKYAAWVKKIADGKTNVRFSSMENM